jgi:hypothetical protein
MSSLLSLVKLKAVYDVHQFLNTKEGFKYLQKPLLWDTGIPFPGQNLPTPVYTLFLNHNSYTPTAVSTSYPKPGEGIA